AALMLLSLAPNSEAQSPREIARRTFSSVVLITMENAGGKTISLGSGFFIGQDVIATSLHVITNATRGHIKLVGQLAKHPIVGFVAIDRQRDLVLLKVSGVRAPALPIGDVSQVQVGDEVYVVGNPLGFEGTFSQGIVSG